MELLWDDLRGCHEVPSFYGSKHFYPHARVPAILPIRGAFLRDLRQEDTPFMSRMEAFSLVNTVVQLTVWSH